MGTPTNREAPLQHYIEGSRPSVVTTPNDERPMIHHPYGGHWPMFQALRRRNCAIVIKIQSGDPTVLSGFVSYVKKKVNERRPFGLTYMRFQLLV